MGNDIDTMKKVTYKTPEELIRLSRNNRAEMYALIRKLRKKPPSNLDEIVQNLHAEAFSSFSCLDCANCCKTIGPRLISKDIERLSRQMRIRPSAFVEQYVVTDEDEDYVFKDHPCPFLLHDNHCTVYANRPKACREYPHTDRKKFFQILNLSEKNRETCPVVFEIFEVLKQKFG